MIWNGNLLSLIEIFLELYPTIQIKFIHTCCNHIQSLYNCWPLPFVVVDFLPLLLLCNHGCSSIFQLTFQLITSGSLFPQSSLQCSDLFLMSPLILLFLFAYLDDSLPEFGHCLLIFFAAFTQCRSAGFICNFIPSFNLLKPLVERRVLICTFARAVGAKVCYKSDKETCLKSITRYN